MDILGKWGAYLLVPQVLIGVTAALLMANYGDAKPVAFGIQVAGAVAVLCIVITTMQTEWAGAAVALTSLAVILVVLSVHDGLYFAAGVLILAGFVSAAIAAMLARRNEAAANEALWYLAVCASPVGALIYFMNRLDEEREKMFR